MSSGGEGRAGGKFDGIIVDRQSAGDAEFGLGEGVVRAVPAAAAAQRDRAVGPLRHRRFLARVQRLVLRDDVRFGQFECADGGGAHLLPVDDPEDVIDRLVVARKTA
ncbi:hypothetical protein ACFSTD_18035 [Novosphingobium colocasiae]